MITILSLVALCAAAIVALLAAFVWVSPMIFFAALAAAFFSIDALKNCKESFDELKYPKVR